MESHLLNGNPMGVGFCFCQEAKYPKGEFGGPGVQVRLLQLGNEGSVVVVVVAAFGVVVSHMVVI